MVAALFTAAAAALGFAASASAQVTATGTMGSNNPPEPTMGTKINQTSMSRLVTVNSIDDFCIFGPPEPGKTIGETEGIQVAWCTQPRNNARVIPDGTLTAVHFVKTDFYVQVMALGDFTKIGLGADDYGGELDPHGATGEGNPVGGNVTSNVTGQEVHYQEWMEFLSYSQVCIRICTGENSTYPAATMCEHKLDEMGCNFVMPGDYSDKVFDTCEGEVAYPPGVYPVGESSYSSFAQRFTGTYTDNGTPVAYTVGDTATPSSVAMTPATSNCVKQTSIMANNVASGSKSGDSGPDAKATNEAAHAQAGNGGNNGAVGSTAPAFALAVTAGVVVLSAAAILL